MTTVGVVPSARDRTLRRDATPPRQRRKYDHRYRPDDRRLRSNRSPGRWGGPCPSGTGAFQRSCSDPKSGQCRRAGRRGCGCRLHPPRDPERGTRRRIRSVCEHQFVCRARRRRGRSGNRSRGSGESGRGGALHLVDPAKCRRDLRPRVQGRAFHQQGNGERRRREGGLRLVYLRRAAVLLPEPRFTDVPPRARVRRSADVDPADESRRSGNARRGYQRAWERRRRCV